MLEEAGMKPNIVLVNCDDLGYGDLGCYGSTKNDTPYLDKLAQDGLRFTDFYMASPVCSASRGALMTGCYPPRIGFGSFHGEWVLFPGHDIGLNPKEKTIAALLHEVGYSTLAVGKWHCGDQKEFLPTRHGFDDYFGLPYSNDMGPSEIRPNMPPLPLIEGEEVIQQQPDQCSLTERYVHKSVQFIRRNKGNPFFLYLAHMHVHVPLYASEIFRKRSRNGDYGACVGAIDWAMGAIVHELKEQGVYDNTLIIFTSDNGSRNDFGESNGALRGTKATTWEGGMRVPLIMHWNGTIVPGVTSELTASMDLYPTLAKLAGAKVPTDRVIDGLDFSDLLSGKCDITPRETLFYYMCNNLEAVRHGDWKLHLSRRPDAGRPSTSHDGTASSKPDIDSNVEVRELYNLAGDLGEQHNVYDAYPDVVELLEEKAQACRLDIGDNSTGVKGARIRPIGKVANPAPLTSYDEDHPYIIALYDRNEVG